MRTPALALPQSHCGVVPPALPVWTLVTTVLGLVLGFLTPPASANPLPYAWALVHVQTGEDPVATCAEVVQFTDATGSVTFDLYVWPSYWFYEHEEIGFETASTVLEWPEDWSFIDATLAPGTEGTITALAANRYQVSLSWPSCEHQGRDRPLFFLARFALNVASEGECEMQEVQWTGCFPMTPYPLADGGQAVPARAGAPCTHCPWPCGDYPNLHWFEQDVLNLEVDEGESVTGELVVGLEDPQHEAMVYDATQPFLSVEAEPGVYEATLTVTAQAAGLSAGEYTGYVRAIHNECTVCCPVHLTVRPAVPVRSVTWGTVKGGFRR
jgi:hypothetical protein